MSKILLKMENISKVYKDGDNDNHVLKELSLEVKEGELAAVIGPSGSGKSTFLSIAGALLSADTGNIIIGNETISNKKSKEWGAIRKDKVGFIFQTHHLLPFLTAKEQLTDVAKAGRGKRRETIGRAEELLKEVGLESCSGKYPGQMSGGERQRVAIARAFMNNPDLILADEPTASLDAARGRQIVEMIRNEVKKRNKAAILVTHDERMLEYVDTVYRINKGKLEKVS